MKCPLCTKECIQSSEEPIYKDRPSFECRHEVNCGDHTKFHYSKYMVGGWTTGGYYQETAIVLPYKVEIHHLGGRILKSTDKNGTESSRKLDSYVSLFKLEYRPTADIDRDDYRFIRFLKLPFFELQSEEKLLEKIKTYLVFS